jgi:hypothetical protein
LTVLIIGVRRKCYQAAIKLGYDVLLWEDGPLSDLRKKHLKGWLEIPYKECANSLSAEVKSFLKSHKISRVIANSEETVILGSMARNFLGLQSLAIDVVQRFHNKFVMKNSAKEAGIPITNYELITDKVTANELIQKLGIPMVIKPVDESGAQDVKIARSLSEVESFMQLGFLAESFVAGTEISVETFIQNGNPIFHNITDYLHQWKKSLVPANLEPNLIKQVLELNDRVIKHFGVDRGMTHSEFYLTDRGPVFGEIAIRPPGGYYMELMQRVYGFDTWRTYVELSCGKEIGELNSVPDGFAAVVMFHPGKGTVGPIEGESKIKERLSEILEFKIRKKPGDAVEDHVNTSNEVGHILFWEKSQKNALDAIEFVEANLKFNLID